MSERGISLAVVLMLGACLPVLAQHEIIRAQVDVVVVPVSVRDSKGNSVDSLKQENFRIFEDGRPQEIVGISHDLEPLSVAVLIDAGMANVLSSHEPDPFAALSSALADGDEAAIYQFDHRYIEKIADFTNIHEDLGKALRLIEKTPGNQTDRSMNLAPLFAATADLETRPPGRRRVIVVFTAGSAGEGTHSVEEVRDRLGQAQVQLDAVLVGHFFPSAPTSELRKYAEPTGGDVYRVTDDDRATALHNTFGWIIDEVHHQYVLTYVSNNLVPGTSPVNRKIEVRTDRRGLKLSHRTGYLQFPVTK